MVETARRMASNGLMVLRFDYRGCGDSHGTFDAFSIQDWVDDTLCVVEFASQQYQTTSGTPPSSISLLGIRLGAAIAMDASTRNQTINRVVMWEPVVEGQSHFSQELRKKLVKEMVTTGNNSSTRAELIQSLKDGNSIDFDGYAISPRLYQELCSIDITSPVSSLPKETLIISVSHRSQPQPIHTSLHDSLISNGYQSTLHAIAIQPFWNLVGITDCSSLIDITNKWLAPATTEPQSGSLSQ